MECESYLAALFLLFVFTFKVGKSYENSVNHGGNTSHQSHDEINCHTQASFNLVFQLKLVESGRQNRLNYGHFLERIIPCCLYGVKTERLEQREGSPNLPQEELI